MMVLIELGRQMSLVAGKFVAPVSKITRVNWAKKEDPKMSICTSIMYHYDPIEVLMSMEVVGSDPLG